MTLSMPSSLSIPSPQDGTTSNWTTTMAISSSTPSEDELYDRLVYYNEKKAKLYIPVIVLMCILMVVGTFGNILVFYVYCCKPTKTSSHFFIMTLAVLDLLTCLIGMPTEITDLRYPYMFRASAACKLLRFTESVTATGSGLILVAVAVDRYLRICKLGKHISVNVARRICIFTLFVSVLLSWPTCLLFGKSKTELEPRVIGESCSFDDAVSDTMYSSFYYGFLGLLFMCCVTVFAIVYIQIRMKIRRHKKTQIGHNSNDTVTARDDYSSDGVTEDPISPSTSMKSKQKGKNTNNIKVTRITAMLFAVTVAYIISFLPFLIVMIVRSIHKQFESNLSPTQEVVVKFCLKSFFINNAINPLIYSFLNINFRQDAKNILKRITSACCCGRSIYNF